MFIDFAYSNHNDFEQTKKSGIFSSGGFGFTIGKRKNSTDEKNTQISHTGSMVGNLKKGDTTIIAKENYSQSGSAVNSVKGDVNVLAKDIKVTSVNNPYSEDKTHKFKQSGLTVSLSVPVIDTATGLVDTVKTVGKSKNSRVNAMAAVNTALQGYDAGKTLQNVADKGLAGGASLSISLGSQKSKSESHIRGGEVQASQIQAGGKANLIATGAKQSNINIIGSDVAGAKGTNLIADNDVNLLASTGKNSERSKNKSSGGSIGLKISSTGEFGVSLAANKGKGYGNGDSVTHRNTHVGSASGKTNIQAGNKLTLKGAQALGKGVKVTAKDLDIESLQDSATYKGKQKNIGGSITIGPAGVSGSANLSKSKANAEHLAVSEQSGILAGDDGFQVAIQNHTDLKGGIITSTQKAENDGKNTFKTGTISTTDLQNHSEYDAKGFAISGGVDLKGGWQGNTKDKQGNPTTAVSEAIGYGKDSDKQSNITKSGIGTDNITITDKTNPISAEQIKTTKTTEQVLADSGLQNRFDKDEVQSEIDLQVKVTRQLDINRQKLKKHFNEKIADLKQSGASQETIDNWQNAGLLVDGITGALYTPNANGLIGDVAQIASPQIAKEIGDYFANQSPTTANKAAHGVAHAVLAAAVAAAGGNDALTAGLSAGSGELAAPMIAKWMFGTDKADKLTAEQKATVSNITGLIGTGAGATTGNVTDAIASGRASENAVDNNGMYYHETSPTKRNDISDKEAQVMKMVIEAGLFPVAIMDSYLNAKTDEDKQRVLVNALLDETPVVSTIHGLAEAESIGDAFFAIAAILPVSKLGKAVKEIQKDYQKAKVNGDVKGMTDALDKASDTIKKDAKGNYHGADGKFVANPDKGSRVSDDTKYQWINEQRHPDPNVQSSFVSSKSTPSTNKYFKTESEWQAPGKGTGLKYKVYQQDIDLDAVPNAHLGDMSTNADLMKSGRAPYVRKGGEYVQLQLHHSRQDGRGSLFELSEQTHLGNTNQNGRLALHPESPNKHADYPVERKTFGTDKKSYWKDRVRQMEGIQ